MKKRLLSVATFCLSLIVAGQSNIDVLHYRFNIELNDNNDTIYGLAEIKLRFLEAGDNISLDLKKTDASGKGMKLESISAPGVLGDTRYNETFTVFFAKPFASADTATLVIKYKGIPADGLIISKNKYGNRTFFADNWPNRGHNWLPCHDVPGDKATVEFIITAPHHYQVVANGIQIEETNLPGNKKRTHWKEDVPISTKVMVIGVADFAVNLSGYVNDCIPVYSWVYPENRNDGFYDYAQAAEIVPWFIQHIGPYGYKKLANVQSKTMFGGLENANTIFYHEGSVTGNRRAESLLAHEIAHQWFGNMATEKTFAHLWLSEGFATYMTILYMESRYGQDTAIYMLKEDREQVASFAKQSNRSVVDNTTDYMDLLNANSYQKGGWILHMLRKQLGDSLFWKSIQTYYARYAGKTADTEDLQKVFEEISGKNLNTFFQQWFYTPGIPQLDVRWAYLEKEKKLSVMLKQLQKNSFEFPLAIEIKTASGKTIVHHLTITKQEEIFLIPVEGPVKDIALDPGLELLFERKY